MKYLIHLSLLGILFVSAFALDSANATIPSCTVVNSPPFWVDDGTTTVRCPTACWDGSFLMCVVNLQREVQCKNGDIQIVGPTRPGDVISTIGSCPAQPPPPT